MIRELKGFLTYSPMNPTTVMELSQKVVITAQKGAQMACVWKKPLEQLGLHPGRLTAGTDSHHTIKERKTIWTKPSWLCSMLIFQGVVSFSSGEGGSKRLGWKKRIMKYEIEDPLAKQNINLKTWKMLRCLISWLVNQPPPTYPPEIRSYSGLIKGLLTIGWLAKNYHLQIGRTVETGHFSKQNGQRERSSPYGLLEPWLVRLRMFLQNLFDWSWPKTPKMLLLNYLFKV